ncbi:MAG: single-stranded-DNA-specific exonuclease RecJ [Pseudomonadota bacterium]
MNWRTPVQRKVAAHELSESDSVIARVLAARGVIVDEQRALALSQLAPVSSLGGIDAAAQLLQAHRAQTIVIVGDFDADGATSAALLMRGLRALGFSSVSSLVPNRFEFGYGLSPEIVDVALQRAPSLIVTVDNGISSVDGVAHARAHGIEVLVTDHHLPPKQLPDATVIVNPNANGDDFSSKALAGVGVAFYVLAALERALVPQGAASAGVAASLLDLVALGTVADVVPLDRNNRILVNAGLQRIRAGACAPGISALLRLAGRDPKRCSAADLGFAAGPRLNAAGRLDDMSIGIHCLLADSAHEADSAARALDQINRDRRELEQDMHESALRHIDAVSDPALPPACVCLYESDWHQGVVGLVASRIKERLHRPVFAFADDGQGALKGSGRSIAGVHLRDVLAEVDRRIPGTISKFGGHAMAAGLTLGQDGLAVFTQVVADVVASQTDPQLFEPTILTDGHLADHHLTLEFAERLAACGPYGQQFAEPCFEGRFAVAESRIVGEQHLKLTLADGIDAIAFRQVREPLPRKGEYLELVYRLDINEWRGRRSVQLIIDQWRHSNA